MTKPPSWNCCARWKRNSNCSRVPARQLRRLGERKSEPRTRVGVAIPSGTAVRARTAAPCEPEYYQAPEPENRYQADHAHISSFRSPGTRPCGKGGGLADVVFGLSNELEIRGNSVEIILPKYDCLRYDHIWGLCEVYKDLWVLGTAARSTATVFFACPRAQVLFHRAALRRQFLSTGAAFTASGRRAALCLFHPRRHGFLWKSGKNPDIIHCHDWQTALAPVFLYEIYQHLGMRHPRVCFTIPQLQAPGPDRCPGVAGHGANRPEYYYHYDRLRDNQIPAALNLMKAGVVYANFTTTVSPRHAIEAKDQGRALAWNRPCTSTTTSSAASSTASTTPCGTRRSTTKSRGRYSVGDLDGKYENKRALRQRLWLTDNEKAHRRLRRRLDPQKAWS